MIDHPTPYLLFTGKGGVGKTTNACASAVALADSGKRVLLISTDPASNLGEVLGVALSPGERRAVTGVDGLDAIDIDPDEAAHAYREHAVGPYRGILPPAALTSIEEQLSGACTVEIAVFDQFARLLGDQSETSDYDHVVFDTAPTGHTLRLLELPAAWTQFLDTNTTGTSCLGPLSGLGIQRRLYTTALETLRDPSRTRVVLVTRPETAAIREAQRTLHELAELGIKGTSLLINGVLDGVHQSDPVAQGIADRCQQAMESLPADIAGLDRVVVPLHGRAPMGVDGLRRFARGGGSTAADNLPVTSSLVPGPESLDKLVDRLGRGSRGVILVMGKGGVGKTTIAARIGIALAERGQRVLLTTTDPAAHLDGAVEKAPPGLRMGHIDPRRETERYSARVLADADAGLDERGRELLREDLRSPCTEEIAVFRAFAEVVAEGEDEVVVVDTAPTGHTLLLLDAAEAYHRDVLRQPGQAPAAVVELLPRLRDPDYCQALLVTHAEATPVHEASRLQDDLARAGITPRAWIINQTLTGLAVADPLLQRRQKAEARWIVEVGELARASVIVPWSEARHTEADPGARQETPLLRVESSREGHETS